MTEHGTKRRAHQPSGNTTPQGNTTLHLVPDPPPPDPLLSGGPTEEQLAAIAADDPDLDELLSGGPSEEEILAAILAEDDPDLPSGA